MSTVINLGTVHPVYKGTYSSTVAYEFLNRVDDGNGKTYEAKQNNVAGSDLSDDGLWQLIFDARVGVDAEKLSVKDGLNAVEIAKNHATFFAKKGKADETTMDANMYDDGYAFELNPTVAGVSKTKFWWLRNSDSWRIGDKLIRTLTDNRIEHQEKSIGSNSGKWVRIATIKGGSNSRGQINIVGGRGYGSADIPYFATINLVMQNGDKTDYNNLGMHGFKTGAVWDKLRVTSNSSGIQLWCKMLNYSSFVISATSMASLELDVTDTVVQDDIPSNGMNADIHIKQLAFA